MDGERPVPGGSLQYAVLVALWDAGPLSAREVHDRVGVPLKLVYTTTTKVLERLHSRGLVDRRRKNGVFLYRPGVERPIVDGARISRTLGGLLLEQPRPAMAALVEAIESIDPALLDELARAVESRRRSR